MTIKKRLESIETFFMNTTGGLVDKRDYDALKRAFDMREGQLEDMHAAIDDAIHRGLCSKELIERLAFSSRDQEDEVLKAYEGGE